MRKEVLWASLIGITFGLVIAFGAWRINSSLKSKVETQTPTKTPSPNSSEFKITLNKPENEDVITNEILNVNGITKANSILMVSGETEDSVLKVDSKGSFSQDIELVAGVNQIRLTAFDPQGATSIEKVLVVFSSSFEEKGLGEEKNATEESDIRQKVTQKVQDILNKPKAYLGVVTDIADATIQIRATTGEIRQIATPREDIAVVNTKGTTNKTVKLTDIAIGDFIVAMGYRGSNAVLTAERILVTDAVVEPKLKVKFAKVTGTTSKNITVLSSGEEETLTPTTKTGMFTVTEDETTKIKTADFEENNSVVYSTNDDSLRSVFVLKN